MSALACVVQTYCLTVTLRMKLRSAAAGLTPRAVLASPAAIQMVDVRIPTTDGRVLILPRYTEPAAEQAMLLEKLHLALPARPPPRIRAGEKVVGPIILRQGTGVMASPAALSCRIPHAELRLPHSHESSRSVCDYNIPMTIRESLKSPRPASDARPVRLMREVRFSIDRDWVRAARGESGFEKALPVTNSWGGWPSAVGVAPFLVLRIIVSGVPDAVTGYLVNIQELDRLLRRYAIPVAAQRLSTSGVGLAGQTLLAAIRDQVRTRVPERCHLETLSLQITPYLSYAINEREPTMVELTQCFEFSASHRLHVADFSDEENLRTFGKCNNPNGHGHNYQVEVTIAGPVSSSPGRVLPLPQFEAVVKREVIDRFDHKHLNTDTAEFARVNPSVENIAHVIWRLLEPTVAPAKLRRVRVWETAKTYAEYVGGSLDSAMKESNRG